MSKLPFSPDELRVTGSYGNHAKRNPPITPRENMQRCVRHADPVWMPMKSDCRNFSPRLIPDNVARASVAEGKKYEGPVGGPDMFGVEWVYVPTVGGSMEKPGEILLNDVSEWKQAVRFPDIDAWDWAGCAAENEAYLRTDLYVESTIFTGLFERLISFLGFENALVALIDEDQQEDVHALFQALTENHKHLIRNLKEYCHVDAIMLHDDWGGQRATFFSPETCREMIAPYVRQIADYCHSLGLMFELHSCGKNDTLVPIMIECGVDLWGGQPINDKPALIRQYGDRIVIGALNTIDGQKPETLREDVEDFFRKYNGMDPAKLFFLMDFPPHDNVCAQFYETGRKLLSQ